MQRKSRNAPRLVSSTQVPVKKTGTQFPTSFPRSLFFPLSLAQGEGKKRDPDNIPTSSLLGGRIFKIFPGIKLRVFGLQTENVKYEVFTTGKRGGFQGAREKRSTY